MPSEAISPTESTVISSLQVLMMLFLKRAWTASFEITTHGYGSVLFVPCFPADGRAAGPHRVARAAGPRLEVLHAECADVRQQPHGPVDHRGFGQQSVIQQALSCLGQVPVSAIEAEILKCVLDGGIPARCLPQEVVKSVETWVPGRRRLLELIGKFH